jgi:hypothetical protein
MEEKIYQVIQSISVDICPTSPLLDYFDPYYFPSWADGSPPSVDCLDIIMPLNEAFIEAMVGSKRPWVDMHHHSLFLPTLDEARTNTSYILDCRKSKFPSSTTHFFKGKFGPHRPHDGYQHFYETWHCQK